MTKDEIQHKLEEIKVKLDEATKRRMEISDNILWLKEQIAEAEKLAELAKLLKKPKLRHGDFGLNKDGNSRITLFRDGDDGGARDDYCYLGKVSDSDITVLGNVFDLMKGWSEPFEYWHSEKGRNYDTDTDLTIVIDTNDCRPDEIWIGTCGNSAWYPRKDAEEIHNALGHAIAELKQKKNKCS